MLAITASIDGSAKARLRSASADLGTSGELVRGHPVRGELLHAQTEPIRED